MTFNTLISACGKAGKYEEALQVRTLFLHVMPLQKTVTQPGCSESI